MRCEVGNSEKETPPTKFYGGERKREKNLGQSFSKRPGKGQEVHRGGPSVEHPQKTTYPLGGSLDSEV